MKQATSRIAAGLLILLAALLLSAGCNDNPVERSSPDYSGTVPSGDYVTAELTDTQITIKNFTANTEKTLGFVESEFTQPEFIRQTELDTDGNFYWVLMQENQALAMLKMQETDFFPAPVATELPLYMVPAAVLTAGDLQGSAYNFMGINASDPSATTSIGMIGFDTDTAGTLRGAVLGNDGSVTSMTADGFTLSMTDEHENGGLVHWANGTGNWQAATTLIGSFAGPVIVDHGPELGGGAGLALPQCEITAETEADFWNTVTGAYRLIVVREGNTYQDGFNVSVDLEGNPGVSIPRNMVQGSGYEPRLAMLPVPIEPVDNAFRLQMEESASFDSARSPAVRDAEAGSGMFQTVPDDFDAPGTLTVIFDPSGEFVALSYMDETGQTLPSFAFGIRDHSWDSQPNE